MMKYLSILFLMSNLLFASSSTFLKELKVSLDQEVQKEQKRLNEFQEDTSSQEKKLIALKKEIEEQKQKNIELSGKNIANQKSLEEKEGQLQEILGGLNAVIQSTKQAAATINKGQQNSFTQVQFPQTKQFFQNITNLKTMNIDDIQKFWLAMSEEIVQSGSVSSFEAPVVQVDGKQSVQKVVRVGQFTAFSDEKFLKLSKNLNSLVVLSNQPNFFRAGDVKEFETSNNEVKNILIDVTRGSLVEMLETEPTLLDRIKQGGIVGYVIIALGLIGLLYALIKMTILFVLHKKIKKQLKSLDTPMKNPLGKIIEVFQHIKDKPINEIEIKVGEEILAQTNKIQSGKEFVKLMATITPLLGLLGTVTGMITTFQVITMFGTGDPKLMAGGISSALVTTVLGLIAAIPLLFAYSYISSKVSIILSILEEQSMGLLAKNYHHV